VARASGPVGEAALRAYLLAEAVDFRRLMVDTLLGHSQESAKVAWAECSKAVDRLAGVAAHCLRRWQLPDGHPWRDVGSIHDDLVLDEHDVLRAAEVATAPIDQRHMCGAPGTP
jgi:hypothetical protein